MDAVPMSETSSMQSSPRLRPIDTKTDVSADRDSAYGSAASSMGGLPQISLTASHLQHLNKQLEAMHPKDILRFAKILFPNLYQSTAFGLTGLVTLDMLSKIEKDTPGSSPVSIIFLDTLYHFQETYDLVERVKARYPGAQIHIFKPEGFETAAEFEATYDKLYELSEEMYDWVAKVEPMQRAYDSLSVAAVLTGRRRSQGGARDKIPVLEVDEERGILKINPMVTWSFDDIQAYIRENDVPYNVLLDRGYKSVGDWHSTSPVGEGEDERAGRWKGRNKTECGIHNKQSRYAQFLQEQDAAAAAQKKNEAEMVDNSSPATADSSLEAKAAAEPTQTIEVTTSSLVETISSQVIEQSSPSLAALDSTPPPATSPAPSLENISPSPVVGLASSSFIEVSS